MGENTILDLNFLASGPSPFIEVLSNSYTFINTKNVKINA